MAKERLKFDYSDLRAEIARNGMRLEDLSKKVGISQTTLSTHLANGIGFTCEQAWHIAKVLKLESIDPFFCRVQV